MITSMTMRELDGYAGETHTRTVDRDTLTRQGFLTIRKDQTEYEFFLAACEYLLSFDEDILSTDYAKIDEVFVTSK